VGHSLWVLGRVPCGTVRGFSVLTPVFVLCPPPAVSLPPSLQALRAVKGILNKLTPEKYERLLAQLLEVVSTADLLKQTISLVFENAVAQPTFCAM